MSPQNAIKYDKVCVRAVKMKENTAIIDINCNDDGCCCTYGSVFIKLGNESEKGGVQGIRHMGDNFNPYTGPGCRIFGIG